MPILTEAGNSCRLPSLHFDSPYVSLSHNAREQPNLSLSLSLAYYYTNNRLARKKSPPAKIGRPNVYCIYMRYAHEIHQSHCGRGVTARIID